MRTHLPRQPSDISPGATGKRSSARERGHLLGIAVGEQEEATAALIDPPPGGGIIPAGDAGQEYVGEADGSGEVRSKKKPRRGGGWSATKLRRKAGEERAAARKARQASAARTRLGREGRRRKISQRRSSPRESMVVRERGA
nr:unnamed protein product [Digitaria exilis]